MYLQAKQMTNIVYDTTCMNYQVPNITHSITYVEKIPQVLKKRRNFRNYYNRNIALYINLKKEEFQPL